MVRAAKDGSAADDEVARLLAETAQLVNQISTASGTVAKEDRPDVPEGMAMYCDVNGCTIMPIINEDKVPMGPMGSMVASVDLGDEYGEAGLIDFVMAEGDGWKLGCDRAEANPNKYCAAIGSNSFTAALTLAEYEDFVVTLRNLQRSVQTMQSGGEWQNSSSGSEEATLEMSTERVWLQGRAASQTLQALQAAWAQGTTPASAFSLRFIFTGMGSGREVSGLWSATAVAEALRSLDAGSAPEAASATTPAAVSVSSQ